MAKNKKLVYTNSNGTMLTFQRVLSVLFIVYL